MLESGKLCISKARDRRPRKEGLKLPTVAKVELPDRSYDPPPSTGPEHFANEIPERRAAPSDRAASSASMKRNP